MWILYLLCLISRTHNEFLTCEVGLCFLFFHTSMELGILFSILRLFLTSFSLTVSIISHLIIMCYTNLKLQRDLNAYGNNAQKPQLHRLCHVYHQIVVHNLPLKLLLWTKRKEELVHLKILINQRLPRQQSKNRLRLKVIIVLINTTKLFDHNNLLYMCWITQLSFHLHTQKRLVFEKLWNCLNPMACGTWYT